MKVEIIGKRYYIESAELLMNCGYPQIIKAERFNVLNDSEIEFLAYIYDRLIFGQGIYNLYERLKGLCKRLCDESEL